MLQEMSQGRLASPLGKSGKLPGKPWSCAIPQAPCARSLPRSWSTKGWGTLTPTHEMRERKGGGTSLFQQQHIQVPLQHVKPSSRASQAPETPAALWAASNTSSSHEQVPHPSCQCFPGNYPQPLQLLSDLSQPALQRGQNGKTIPVALLWHLRIRR